MRQGEEKEGAGWGQTPTELISPLLTNPQSRFLVLKCVYNTVYCNYNVETWPICQSVTLQDSRQETHTGGAFSRRPSIAACQAT